LSLALELFPLIDAWMDRAGEQWNLIATIPPDRSHAARLWTDRRQVLNGVLWTLRPGAPWDGRICPDGTASTKRPTDASRIECVQQGCAIILSTYL
jgi:transposase